MLSDHLIAFLVTAVGVAMGFSYFPQAYRVWRTKSSDDISLGTYLMLGAGMIVWIFYGLYRCDPVIILSFLPGAVGSWLIVGLTLYYRNRKGP